jgi:chromate transporter
MSPAITLTAADWLALLAHFLSLSLLAVGGAITTAPDMHRYLVATRHWLSDAQFSSAIAIAQAAPGPNVLFVALMGWGVGLNAGGGPAGGWHAYALALLGVVVTMTGILLPSGVLTFAATRWAHRHRERRAVRAFKIGMAPIVIALLIATGWLLTAVHGQPARDWPLWLLTAAATLLVWRTRLHLLWLIGTGAVLGMLGWV